MDELNESANVCIICSIGFNENDDKVSVGEKGVNTIIKACQFRKDKEKENSIKKRLDSNQLKPTCFVHRNCRKRYTDLRRVEISTPPAKK
jgi:hypothetical protein